ncbi:hypothetical protein KUCAC02_020579, partial [Chaenocephalus aceratus]
MRFISSYYLRWNKRGQLSACLSWVGTHVARIVPALFMMFCQFLSESVSLTNETANVYTSFSYQLSPLPFVSALPEYRNVGVGAVDPSHRLYALPPA